MEKEFKNIDDLLRDTLNGFEKKPSEGVWANVSSSLPIAAISWIFTSKYLWSFIGLIGLVVMVYFLSTDKETAFPGNETLQPVYVEDSNAQTESIIKSNANSTTPEIQTPASNSNQGEIAFRNEKDNIPNQKLIEKSHDPSTSGIPAQTETNERLNTVNVKNETYLLTGYFPFLMKGTFTEEPIQVSYALIMKPQYIWHRNTTQSIYPKGLNPERDDYGSKSNLIYGFNILPELILPGSGKVNKSIGFEITGRYIFKDVFLETGLGINVSEDDGKFTIDYEQYDSIGYYYKVNSFTIDESGQPVFNTGVEAVYDTVGYSEQKTKRNTYTYLYLPLSAGINLYQFKKFSINLQAGVIYSLMVAKNEQESGYENENATSIDITNETPARLSSNWILKTSLGLHYQLTPKVSLNIEPHFKYYLIPVYEQIYNPKPTFGGGLRVGLYFNL